MSALAAFLEELQSSPKFAAAVDRDPAMLEHFEDMAGLFRILERRTESDVIEICDVAARFKAVGDCPEQAGSTFAGDAVHIRRICIFERCHSAEFGQFVVCHPIAEHNEVFHSGISISSGAGTEQGPDSQPHALT